MPTDPVGAMPNKLTHKPPTKKFPDVPHWVHTPSVNTDTNSSRVYALSFDANTNTSWVGGTVLPMQLPSGVSVKVFVTQEAEKRFKYNPSAPQTTRLGSRTPTGLWKGGGEKSRIDFRVMEGKNYIKNLDVDIEIDLWATPKEGDKIHLRTLIDEHGSVGVRDDVGVAVTKYFTITEDEIAQNTGAEKPTVFCFTVVLKASIKLE
jgi:hypothetical protein